MSDIPSLPSFKIPPDLLRQLKESEANLAQMRKNIDGLRVMGQDVTMLEDMYASVSKARKVLLDAFGV